jgi:ABC-type branched-subunit amino acid transport system ATPase component
MLVEQNAFLALPIPNMVYILTDGQIVYHCTSREIEDVDI